MYRAVCAWVWKHIAFALVFKSLKYLWYIVNQSSSRSKTDWNLLVCWQMVFSHRVTRTSVESSRTQQWCWPCREEGETDWYDRVGKKPKREKIIERKTDCQQSRDLWPSLTFSYHCFTPATRVFYLWIGSVVVLCFLLPGWLLWFSFQSTQFETALNE